MTFCEQFYFLETETESVDNIWAYQYIFFILFIKNVFYLTIIHVQFIMKVIHLLNTEGHS